MSEFNVVISKKIIDFDKEIMGTDNLIKMNEIYLPKILVNLGLYKSISQIRRDRQECDKEVDFGFTVFDTKQYKMARKYGWDNIYSSISKFKRVYIWRPER